MNLEANERFVKELQSARPRDINLHLAVAELPVKFWKHLKPEGDRTTVTCMRSVLMKPEHLEWVDRIVKILKECAN